MTSISFRKMAMLVWFSILTLPVYAALPVALRCNLKTGEQSPPMFVTFNQGAGVVQVTMAGQTAIHETFADGSILWWQFKGRDGVIVRSRLNRADGSIVITNEHPFEKTRRQMVTGMCEIARNKF